MDKEKEDLRTLEDQSKHVASPGQKWSEDWFSAWKTKEKVRQISTPEKQEVHRKENTVWLHSKLYLHHENIINIEYNLKPSYKTC